MHCGIDPEKSGQKLLFEKLLICNLSKIQERPALISPARNCNEKQKTQLMTFKDHIAAQQHSSSTAEQHCSLAAFIDRGSNPGQASFFLNFATTMTGYQGIDPRVKNFSS